MIRRFQGRGGPAALRQAILDQQCVGNHPVIAEAIHAKVELLTFNKGELLIEQGAVDNHILFILCGRVSILVNGREMAIRQARQHVGEMALIDSSEKRSASILAIEETVVAKVTEPAFTAIANEYPQLWRCLALELGNRLRERSKHVRAPNPRPVIFIGSSAEGLKVAEQIQLGLAHAYVVPQVWTSNVFLPGSGTTEALEAAVMRADFGVFVCTPDDQVSNAKRNIDMLAPRDNVVFELGMCLGSMGRHRSYFVRPRGVELKIPTDLLGLTPIDYVADDSANLSVHLGSVCTQIKQAVERLGPR